ncbi:kinase-like domain, phloem protein 2-like protein [Tanacetum coccineum]
MDHLFCCFGQVYSGQLCTTTKKKPSELYNGLQYEFQEETYYSFLSDNREDGWSTAELFQFTTNQITAVDELEIRFNIEHFKVIAIEGIEFQPLDDEVEHGVLVDNQMDTQASDTNWGERLPSMDNNERLPTRVALKSVGWRWQYLPETSFEEVGQAPVSKFRISCNIESKILSRDTTYAGYLVYKQKLYVFQPAPAQVEDVNLEEMSDIYLQIPQTPVLISGEVCEDTRNRSHRPNIKGIPQERRDGFMEVQIWEFKTNRNTANIPMDLELSSYDKRSLKGLKAEGIEFRPIGKN